MPGQIAKCRSKFFLTFKIADAKKAARAKNLASNLFEK
jgi:hypothetical protein